jgi:DNA-binding response OmpR family regulator
VGFALEGESGQHPADAGVLANQCMMPKVLEMAADDRLSDLVFEFLMEEGYQISLAEHCKQAIAVMERKHGVIVVLDLLPPGSDRENIMRWLKTKWRLVAAITSLQEWHIW